ncbi:MAG: hypothetical protein CSA26_08605 [Desulfobacterales bacterium]|nr:MAG: hypothetical protein CSA26_08605 [Desulfobacterales bacterium]
MKTNDRLTVVSEAIVPPARGGRETRWVLVAAVCILVVCSAAIVTRTRDDSENRLKSWQLNAFSGLNGNEIGVFNALLTASIEIEDIHTQEGYWIDVNALEKLYIPPFARDAAWKKQGRIVWKQKIINAENRHIAMYMGTPANDDIGGTFLLLMLHDHEKKQGNVGSRPGHAPFEIWFNRERGPEFPRIITDQAFIGAGWKEVIALTGKDESTRM